MSNLLQAIKTATLSHESILTALCALGRQRRQDQELLQTCNQGARAWVLREIAMTDIAIAGLQNAVYAVRYCHACGHLGEVAPPAVNCCPDGQAAMVHPEIARQAHAGVQSALKEHLQCAA